MAGNAASALHPRAAAVVDPDAARRFVEIFRAFWSAPSVAGFRTALTDDVTLVQPLAPVMHGVASVERTFATIFAWLPDLRGEVARWAPIERGVMIEFRLRATIGGRPFEWSVIDRFELTADGKASARVTWFDSLPLLIAATTRPRGWFRLLRSGVLGPVVRSFRSTRRSG